MDYEKSYKAVLNTAKQWIKDGCTDKEKICLECVFPELRESKDEKIRKALVEYHKQQFEKNCDQEIGLFHKDAIAYLEKQKEQKPKFYPGDVIKCTSTGSLWVRCKGGDNVKSDGHTACIGGGFELASEEEAVQFFQELNENGYQWDCIKGMPIKKEQKPAEYIPDFVKFPERYKSGREVESVKPTEWSDNFEENIRNLLNDKLTWHSEDGSMSSTVSIDDKTLKDIIRGIWFYVGKEAMKHPNKELNAAEWSEEDEQTVEEIKFAVLQMPSEREDTRLKCFNWLELLRFRLQPSRSLANSFMNYLDEHKPDGKMCLSNGECADIEAAFKKEDWAKIIRYVNKYQPHWKPSEEQMKVFLKANPVNLMPEELSVYISLSNDIQKLK